MASRVPIKIKLDSFEGPLDLLVYLIQQHEMDVTRISLSKITDQYLAWVRAMQVLNFEVAGDFLLMAATLIMWKSNAVLPRDEEEVIEEEEEDLGPTQEELVLRLLEHQRFRAAGDDLAQLPRLGEDVFKREQGKRARQKVWKDMNVTDLALCYQQTLAHERKRKKVLRKETVSLSEKIQNFSDTLKINEPTDLRETLPPHFVRGDVVVSFLAALEMSRLKKMKTYQEGTYQAILLELLDRLSEVDLTLAKGFDAIPTAEAGASL